MKKIIIHMLLLWLISSCNPVPEPEANNYVVEAYVYSGEPVNEITIKSLVPLSEPEGESEIIVNAAVTLMKNGVKYELTYNSSTRKYQYIEFDLEIFPEDVLDIEIDVNGRIATANTIVPTVPVDIKISKTEMIIPEINGIGDFINGDPLADAELTVDWSNPDNELHYAVVEFRSNLLKPILPGSIQEVVDGILEDFAIITVPSTDTVLTVSGALLPSYGPYVVKIYKVNQEYADLYESETQDSRDLNDPPSNLINAQGIFSAFASDSVSFEVIKP
jgi:hypothetical protein